MFSAAKTFAQYQELSALLTDENGKARSWQSFKDEATKTHSKYNLNYLQTEFRTAQRSALMAAKWKDAERTKHLYDLMYEDAGDEKVRHSHAALNGIVRPVDDGFWDTHCPPLEFNCRCRIRKVPKGTPITPVEKLKGLPKTDKQFRFNPGKKGMIFSNEHPYIKNLNTNHTRELQAVKDYGLPSVNNIYARGKHIAKTIIEQKNKQQAIDWFTKISKDGKRNFSATIGNVSHKVVLSEKALKHIINDNTDNRWKWTHKIPSILLDANEVYLLNYANKYPTYRFIKYFNGKVLAVNVEVKTMQVQTAYEVKNYNSERVGVLMGVKK